ncbi:hypothetical protein GCM10011316_38910 [Roseibium aquae]|uniref:Peptidase YpeB-like protein n=1 Tax=Roseibium aquae TaxID=1323746 RepID=A0A916TNK4_9HYPH|nr:hypothetical protein [Roseibium aquae]GGB63250.1 hypothetical protein GCM10011316_38910 [Roseibium aquae]
MTRLLVLFCSAFLISTAAGAACLSQAEARAAVASGQARSLASVQGQAGGEIVKAQLCLEGGRYVYRLSVLVNGKVTTKVISAN